MSPFFKSGLIVCCITAAALSLPAPVTAAIFMKDAGIGLFKDAIQE